MKYALGIDVGGTFTDFVAVSETGRVLVHKHLTTPADPSVGVLEGTRTLCAAAGVKASDATRIIHGTTLVANSLIQRRGAKTGLITTEGFRDVLEIGRESRYDLYDMNLERPEPLVRRSLRFELRERVRADGSVEMPLDEDAVRTLAQRLRESKIEAVAIAFLHSYANPTHERRVAEMIQQQAPDIDVTLSSDIAPEWREYERSSTAVANAFVRPLVRRYLERLENGFAEFGAGDRLYIVLSQGGVTSPQIAGDLAVQLVESGPAGGVIAASFFGRRLGLGDMISFDMGGTTTKVSLVKDNLPLQSPDFEVARVARFKRGSGLPLKVPTIELVEIGAGGGSLGRVDALGLLKVGPQSAGADPGPACYGRGGTQATVTDADLHLGFLNPNYFLGGEMSLEPEFAEAALARLGAQVGLDANECARGLFEIVNHQMALALQTHVVERGQDPRDFALVAFGGAGPVHAYEVARHLGLRRVVCPPVAGVASALGFLVTSFAINLVRTFPTQLTALDWDGVRVRYAEMESQALDLLGRAGAEVDRIAFERSVDMRYVGQGYTVPVRIPDGSLGAGLEKPLLEAFYGSYERHFGSYLKTAEVEALHWRLVASAPQAELTMTLAGNGDSRRPDPLKGTRSAYFPEAGDYLPCAVYDRYSLPPNFEVQRPALIEERESTIVVGPSGTAAADDLGNLVITMES